MLFNHVSSAPAAALFKDLMVHPEEARSILRPQKDPVYGHGFTLNPYRGCSHGCRYCYVQDYPAADPSTGKGALYDRMDWGRWAAPKLNAPELLWAQRHRLHGQAIFMSSATDPYQPIEREFRLTRRCLEVLLRCPTTRILLHTRSPLVLQDLELLRAFGSRLSVGFSIPTDDDTVRQVVEPSAPPIPSRWAAVERLTRAGIRVGLSATPLMPVQDIAAFARRARDSGISSAWAGGLRLLDRDPFFGVLQQQGWLHILQPEYAEGVNTALREALPPGDQTPKKRRGTPRKKEGSPIKLLGFQPALAF